MYLTWTANDATTKTCASVDEDFPCENADYTKYYIAAVLYGLTDCAFQTAASAVCAQDFVKSGLAADAFALYRTFQSLGGVIGFGLSPMLSTNGGTTSDPDQLQTELTITAAVGIAALVGLMVYSATPDTARTPITTKDAPLPVAGAYSQAVSAGGFLYLVRLICSHRHIQQIFPGLLHLRLLVVWYRRDRLGCARTRALRNSRLPD